MNLVICHMALGHAASARDALAAWWARDPNASMRRAQQFMARAPTGRYQRLLE